MDFGQNELKVWADTPEFGSSEIFVSCSMEGEPISTSFNVKFLQDFINVINDEEIVLELTTPKYPVNIKTKNPESNYKYIMMPIVYVNPNKGSNP